MTKDVLVSISGVQFDVDENDPIELITVGDYYNKNGKHFVKYEERSENNSDITRNTVKLTPHSLEMMKSGASNVHMVFEEGKSNLTYYDTPVGSLFIGINTESLKIVEVEDQLDILIKYSLEVNYTHMSNCEIKMQVKSKGSLS